MNVFVTDHAIHRFQERVSRCHPHLAEQLLRAAAYESRPANKREKRKAKAYKQLEFTDGFWYRYHRESCLFLVIEPTDEGCRIITCYPVIT